MSQEQTIPLSECTYEQFRARPLQHPTHPPIILDFSNLSGGKPFMEEYGTSTILGIIALAGICIYMTHEQ